MPHPKSAKPAPVKASDVNLCHLEGVGKKWSGGAGATETAATGDVAGQLLLLCPSLSYLLQPLGQQVFHGFNVLRIDPGCSECLARLRILLRFLNISNARMSLESSFHAVQRQRTW